MNDSNRLRSLVLQQVKELKNEHENLRNQKHTMVMHNGEIKRANKNLKEYETKAADVQKRIQLRQAEHAQLRGIFTGNRRRKLASLIEEDQQELSRMNAEIKKLRQLASEQLSEIPEVPTLDETGLQVCQLYLRNGLIEDAYAASGNIDNAEIRDKLFESSPALWKEFKRRLKKPGSLVYFGSFPQMAVSNTYSPILWKTLDVNSNCSLLISQKALWKAPFFSLSMNDTNVRPYWNNSPIDLDLNISFLYEIAFTNEELSAIVARDQSGMKVLRNPNYSRGPSINKPVFILNTEQVKRYFPTDSDRKCYPTSYALVKTLEDALEDRPKNAKMPRAGATSESVSWWVRDIYEWDNEWHEWSMAFVNQQGGVGISGMSANSNLIFVRPAIWIRNDF